MVFVPAQKLYGIISPAGISSRPAAKSRGGTVLTVEIYSQYARKNLDLLEQGPRGNDDVSIVCARKYEISPLVWNTCENLH